MSKKNAAALIVGLLLLAACLACFYWSVHVTSREVSDISSHSPQLKLRHCDYVSEGTYRTECYWFTTASDGLTAYRLPVVVFLSTEPNKYSDPLVFLSGGPGESDVTGTSSLSFWDDWLSRVKIDRDFVLLDLRGSNSSKPSLECDQYYAESKRLFDRSLSFAQEYERLYPIVVECLGQFDKQFGQELKGFSSLANANDVRELLISLGYQRWNYLGVSYGTRVALLAALTQTEVNKLILDSPYIFSQGRLSDAPELWFKAVTRFLESEPKGSVKGLVDAFQSAMKRLKAHPIKVKVEEWSTGRSIYWVLNDHRFVSLVYSALYSSESEKELNSLINALAEGENIEVNSLYDVFYNQVFDPSFNSMLYLATECNDNPLVSESEFDQALSRAGFLAPLFAADWRWDICRSEFFRPSQLPDMSIIDVPVLVAAGELDPITTAEHAAQLSEHLSHGYRLDLVGAAHAEFFSGECAERLIPKFLVDGKVDEACD